MSKPKLALYWAASLRRLRDRRARDRREDPRRGRGLRHRLLAGGHGLQVQGRRGDGRRLHRRLPLQRRHPQLRERAHRQAAAPEEQDPGRLRRLRQHGRHPGAGQRVDRPSEIMDLVYTQEPSIDNPEQVFPQTSDRAARASSTLPQLYDTVKTLDQTVDGRLLRARLPPRGGADLVGRAPPSSTSLQERRQAAAQGRGAGRRREDLLRRVPAREGREEDHRTSCGPGRSTPTRRSACSSRASSAWARPRGAGCGSRCIKAAMPCRGCYGPPPGVVDQGAKMLSTLASIIDAETPEKIAEIAATMTDPLGTFYRFGLAGSSLRRGRSPRHEVRRRHEEGQHRPDHPARGPRQDRDLPQRRRRGGQRLLPGAGAARLRALLRGPAGRGAGAHHAAHLRRLPRGAPHGRHQGHRRRVRRASPRRPARKLRELLYNAFYAGDHTTHFFVLAGPDFVVGPDRRPRRAQHPRRGRQGGHGARRRRSSRCAPRQRAGLDHRRQGDPPRRAGCRAASARRSRQEERDRVDRDRRRPGRVRQGRAAGLRRRRARQQRLRRSHQERRLLARDLLHGHGRREQQGQLLRRQDPRRRPRRAPSS